LISTSSPPLAAALYQLRLLHRSPWLGFSVDLVLEATVLVLAEERETDGGEGVGLEELEALFEGVVDLDLAGAVEDHDAASSVGSYMLAKDMFLVTVGAGSKLTTPQAGSPSRPQ
jgi:hypothetical protein